MKLKIISTEKKIYEGSQVDTLSLPGVEGRMQILPDHANLISQLEIGEVVVEDENGRHGYLLNGGFVVVRDNEILLLADNVAIPEDVVASEVEQAIKRAQEKISQSTDPAELIQLEKQLKYERFKKDKLSG